MIFRNKKKKTKCLHFRAKTYYDNMTAIINCISTNHK
jgi:hypothetical protein